MLSHLIKMSCDKIESLKHELLSATKQKLRKEAIICKLRNSERSLEEEITILKAETEYMNQQLQELKRTIAQTDQQISMIDICKISEMTKLQNQNADLDTHRMGFERLFQKERNWSEIYNRELEQKEIAEHELQKQKEKEISEKNEQQARDAAAIEAECASIERECTVLKKRNNAKMLTLKRKLVETEKVRRELMKKKKIDIGSVPQIRDAEGSTK